MLATHQGDPAWSNAPHLGEAIGALVEGELGPGEEAKARAHLDDCADCRTEHARIASAVSAVKGLGPARAPLGFASRVLRRVRSTRRAARLRVAHQVSFEGSIVVLLAAACAAAVIAYLAASHTSGAFVRADPPTTAVGHP